MIINKDTPIYGYIYLITNKVNGKIYIGQTTNSVVIRWTKHKSDASRKTENMILHKAINRYGEHNFIIEPICYCYSRENLNECEISIINSYDSTNTNIGYNVSLGGSCAFGPERGKKISKALMGHPVSAETRKKFSDMFKGRTVGGDISKYTRGRKYLFCEKVKRKMFRKGKDHPNSKPVAKLDDLGNEIERFESLSQATKKLKIHGVQRSIKSNLKIKSGGYFWKHIN